MNRFYGLYRDAVWGLKIGFRGVIFPGSGCIYLQTVQYGCFCLKIPEIVADIYMGTVQLYRRVLVRTKNTVRIWVSPFS